MASAQPKSQDFSELSLSDMVASTKVGKSEVRFSPGKAADTNSSRLTTLAVVTIGLSPEIIEKTYEYLYSMQKLSQRLRIVIVTDSADLKSVRRYEWLVEHIISQHDLEKIRPDLSWEENLNQRINSIAKSLDVEEFLLPTVHGITRRQHDLLCNKLKVTIPLEAVS